MTVLLGDIYDCIRRYETHDVMIRRLCEHCIGKAGVCWTVLRLPIFVLELWIFKALVPCYVHVAAIALRAGCSLQALQFHFLADCIHL